MFKTAKHVGKVWISGEKNPLLFFMTFQLFFPWARNINKWSCFAYCFWWTHGCYLTALGRWLLFDQIAARALATYLIPWCIGRWVRLGSESSSGGGVWKSGNLEIWEFGDLGIWRSGNLEIWGPGNPEIWGPNNQKNKNSKKSNPFCPKCRQGLD